MKKNLLLVAPVLMLAACGDNNEASESNFKKSISKIAEQQSVCLPLILEIQNPDGSPARKVAIGETQIQIADKDKNNDKNGQPKPQPGGISKDRIQNKLACSFQNKN